LSGHPASPLESRTPAWILPALVIAHILGNAPWLASSAVLPELTQAWGFGAASGGLLISAVQGGFITGTLLLALTNLADLFPPHRIFAVAAVTAAATNLAFAFASGGLAGALFWRFATGFALAGVYPVGMKIAVSWFPQTLGQALGWILAAGAIGTSSSFLIAAANTGLAWQTVLITASMMAIAAGGLVGFTGTGPHLQPAPKLQPRMMLQVFRIPAYRASALGYFGHMWEIYAFWGLAPVFAQLALAPLGWSGPRASALTAFLLVGSGAIGCVVGGKLSLTRGSRWVAAWALGISGMCCLLAPLAAGVSSMIYLAILWVWGVSVVADSAQFSALSAQACPADYVGTALTVQNAVGFALTILSIELTARLLPVLGPWVSWGLAPGPLVGLWFLLRGAPQGHPAPRVP
jgi:hypothetical protein